MSDGLQTKYFVLKPAGDDDYAVASRAALKAYAKSIDCTNAILAHELYMWEIKEQGNTNRRHVDAQFDSDPDSQKEKI